MNYKITITLLMLLTFKFMAATNHGEITFISNEAFMINYNGNKIFIDALYNYTAGGGIFSPDTSIRNRIINNQDQFANAQAFLITHNHPDHYDKTMMMSYLKNNPNAMLVAQPDIISGITRQQLQHQLVEANVPEASVVELNVNNIKINAYNLIHDTQYRTHNLGYLVDFDGFKIFHAGDNTFEIPEEYINYDLSGQNIDVAFLHYKGYWRTAQERAFIEQYIKPKYIVLMHMRSTDLDEVKAFAQTITNPVSPIIVPDNPLLKITITDNGYTITQDIINKTNISQSDNQNINLYPNPANNFIYFNNINTHDAQITFYNSNGKFILKQKITNNNVNVQQLAPGVYTCVIKGVNCNAVKKIVIQ